jgi:chromosome segregation ATPase
MLTIQELVLIFALIGVLGGWAMGRIGAWAGDRREGRRPDEVNHRIRALEADLRVAQRKAEEAEIAIERNREETEALRAQAQGHAAILAGKDAELELMQKRLADECAKTQNLRQELTTRAEETIRASVRVKEAETELSVARAGSDAVLEQIHRLAAEREELTGRLRALQAEVTGRATGKVTRLPVRDPTER